MAENAFLAALLKMAAEERLNAIAARSMVLGYDASSRTDQEFDNTALEAEVRAEVYESFAHRLIAQLAEPYLLAEFARATSLFGPAELLDRELPFEFKMDYTPPLWQRNYMPIINSPQSFIITSTN